MASDIHKLAREKQSGSILAWKEACSLPMLAVSEISAHGIPAKPDPTVVMLDSSGRGRGGLVGLE